MLNVSLSYKQLICGWLLLAATLIIFDQLTKFIVIKNIGPFDTLEIFPFLAIIFTMNPGAAFSILADASGWQRWFLSTVAFIASLVLVFMLFRHARDRFLSLGLVLILAGALGNLIDRMLYGAVVDFILIYWGEFRWPAFNVADSCISVGAGILLFDGLFRKDPKKSEAQR